MKRCLDCQTEIKPSAKRCVHCAAKVNRKNYSTVSKEKKICEGCNEEFEAPIKTQKFCSRRCKEVLKTHRLNAGWVKMVKPTNKSAPLRLSPYRSNQVEI
jgi:hypothetical protein